MRTIRSLRAWLRAVHSRTFWFTEREAWALFRLGAFSEAVGWTLLIIGIVYKHLEWPGYAIVIALAGRFHGMLFGLYLIFAVLGSRSLGWGMFRIIFAITMSIPPYGSLAFEQYMAHQRKKHPPVPSAEEMHIIANS